MKKKIVIIGAGVGGLATAIRLAKKGHSVSIFESASFVGGKCHVIERNGFKFDTGPSLLTIPAVYRDLFMKSGKRLEHILDLQPVDPAFTYNFSDGKKLVFSNLSIKKNCDEIEKVLGKSSGDQWHRLMQLAERMWDISRTPFIESELRIRNIIREITLRKFLAIRPFSSLRKYVRKITKDQHLQYIVDRYATYSGSDPRKAPAPLLTIPFIESAFGAWHIKGGLGNLANALGQRAKELGVEIHLETKVKEIIVNGGVAVGVKLASGEKITADVVVANADAKVVYNDLIPQHVKYANKERKKLAKRSASFSGFSLFLGLDNSKISGEIPKLSHHNIWFPEDYDQEFKSLFDSKTPVADPTIYICSPSDETMVPKSGCESWSVLINAPLHDPKNGMDWSQIENKYAEKIIEKLDRLGLKVSERLVYFEFRSPKDLQEIVGAPGGSIYGTSSNGAGAAFFRAKNRSDVSNLYLVGGSTHPGGGLPLVGISAEIVSNAID